MGIQIPIVGNATAAQVLAGQSFSSIAAGIAAIGTLPAGGDPIFNPATVDQLLAAGDYTGATFKAVTGTAAAADVRAGKTFASSAGIGVAGTVTDNGALGTYTPGTVDQAIPAGITTGGTVAGDGNLVAANIVSGKSIFGVAGGAKQGASGSVAVANGQTSITVNCGFQPAHVAVVGLGTPTYASGGVNAFDSDISTTHFYYGITAAAATITFSATGFTLTFPSANVGTLYWVASQ